MGKNSNQIDMLHGPLWGKIFVFSLPLIASGILQQSFNAVDVAVIGSYDTSRAMAAVGSNGPIISIMVNLFLGIAVGANVVIANYIGQRHDSAVKRSVGTVAVVSVVSGLILLVAGTTLARPILELMSAPPDVIDLATLYLRIYFCGMPFMMAYNFGSAIMRSMGDTRRPFYALMVATVVNTVLDWVLVACFDMGVAGVAIGTVVANAVNAGIIVWLLMREPEPFRLDLRKIGMSGVDLRKMLQIGVPAGLQGMVFSISNVFIQSSINKFGADAVAGSAAALTYEAYCYYIINSFGAATIAFVSQNYGAGLYSRCRKAVSICMTYAASLSLIADIGIVWGEHVFLSVFTSDPEVVRYASIRLHTALMFQWLASSYEISGAYMRGLGYSVLPMVLTIFGTCVLRLVWVYTVHPVYNDFHVLMLVYPVSWIITGTAVVTAALILQHRLFGGRPDKPQPPVAVEAGK